MEPAVSSKPSGICSFGQELSDTRKHSLWSGIMNPSFCSLSLLLDMTKHCLGSMTTMVSLSWPGASTSAYEGQPDPRLNFMIGQRVGRHCGERTTWNRNLFSNHWKKYFNFTEGNKILSTYYGYFIRYTCSTIKLIHLGWGHSSVVLMSLIWMVKGQR